MFEFYQNALLGDAQVVAYSYRPIQNPTALPFLSSSKSSAAKRAQPDSIYLECAGPAYPASKSASLRELNIPDNVGEKSPSGRPRSKPIRKRFFSNLDRLQSPEGLEEKQLCNEIIKGQTFLSMASLSFQPKPVRMPGNVTPVIKYHA